MHFSFYLVTMKPNAPRYSLDCPKNFKNARNKNPSAFFSLVKFSVFCACNFKMFVLTTLFCRPGRTKGIGNVRYCVNRCIILDLTNLSATPDGPWCFWKTNFISSVGGRISRNYGCCHLSFLKKAWSNNCLILSGTNRILFSLQTKYFPLDCELNTVKGKYQFSDHATQTRQTCGFVKIQYLCV